ncbi:MAG TPA: hypothetical protein VKA60_10625 [Blastocatellia bacterium]|nr:hypothetical protein [Blastocatellia bacterium]
MITCDSTIISNAWHVTAGDHRRVIDQATSAAAQSHINGRFERLTDQAAAATFASSPAICASAGMFTVTK